MAIIIIRTIIIYLALLVTMRVLGKRQLGELELSEFVVASRISPRTRSRTSAYR